MQGTGRLLVSSARYTARLSQGSGAGGIRTFYSRPPPSVLVSTSAVQRRGYRRSATAFKEDDDKRSKPGKDAEKRSEEKDVDSSARDQSPKGAEKPVESARGPKSGEPEFSGSKERRTKDPKTQKTLEETVRPAIISRNQTLSLVADPGGKSRLILSHDHPEKYPQCMALAMSGRPILPGFYSSSYRLHDL
jgi:hypothetical protein